MASFKHIFQTDSMDCGAACLCMIARHYGKNYSLEFFRKNAFIGKEGISMLGLSMAAEKAGMHSLCAKISIEQLANEIILPCILHWDNKHYVICHKVSGKKNLTFHICDPAFGCMKVCQKELYRHWISGKFEGEEVGVAMQIEPGINFHNKGIKKAPHKFSMKYFLKYIMPHKWSILQLLLGALVLISLGYISPFISQAIVDIGILKKDLAFIILMVIAQIIINTSKTIIIFFQSWISLRMNTIINVNLVSNYLNKLSQMPMSFFESKTMGDILQRIGDHDRIKSFLMNDTINVIFSITTFIAFVVVLGIYNIHILSIFLLGNAVYVTWVLSFMKYRKELDNKAFHESALLQNNMVQFIQGMQEIKLNCIEREKCWEWEHLQARLYKISRKAMLLGQIQSAGSLIFSSTTGVVLSYITAQKVVTGEMTLGMMTSLSFILGQVAAPIGSFIGFAQRYQDAKISLERLADIHSQDDEHKEYEEKKSILPKDKNIILNKVSFSYSGNINNLVLKNISIQIPQNKITAIVGKSGCGKTTLIKLLQGLYKPLSGEIMIGDTVLENINKYVWRNHIGAVMQDGYIFSDSISKNITLHNEVDIQKLESVLKAVNLNDFIQSLPHGYDTKIGNDGMQLSQGQRQRILLARILYRKPQVVFLDEATNALDTQNEFYIMNNIRELLYNHTIIIVAHRLSTIKKADNIIVIDNGEVIEQGTHERLLEQKGTYFQLINTQLNKIQ